MLAGAALLVLFLLARGVFEGAKMLDYPPAAQMALSAALLACVFFAWAFDRMPTRGAMLSILGLILFEIGMVTTVNYPHIELGWRYLAKLSEFDDIAGFLRAQPGNFRIYTSGDDIGFNFGDWYGFDEYGGLGAGMTENIANMNGADGSYHMLGVSYYLGRQPFRSQAEPIFRSRSGVNVYPMPDPFPRAWTVHTVESKPDPRLRQAYLNVPADQLKNWTFVFGPAPPVSTCAGQDTTSISRIDATHLDIEADMTCPGMLIAGNTYFPGWRARVDGSRTKVYEAYGFLQGVVVPAGHHVCSLPLCAGEPVHRSCANSAGLGPAGLARARRTGQSRKIVVCEILIRYSEIRTSPPSRATSGRDSWTSSDFPSRPSCIQPSPASRCWCIRSVRPAIPWPN